MHIKVEPHKKIADYTFYNFEKHPLPNLGN